MARANQASRLGGIAHRLPEFAALTLGVAAPDAEPLVVVQGVRQALGPDRARRADPFRGAGRPALLREEDLRVDLGAQRPLRPVRQIPPVVVVGLARRPEGYARHRRASSAPTAAQISAHWAGVQAGTGWRGSGTAAGEGCTVACIRSAPVSWARGVRAAFAGSARSQRAGPFRYPRPHAGHRTSHMAPR